MLVKSPRPSLAVLTTLAFATVLCSPALARHGLTPHARESADVPDPHVISTLVTPLNDLEANVHVSRYEPDELEKIGSDFKATYSLRSLTLDYKKPGKIRLEGKSATRGSALMILNGATRFYAVPKLHIKKTEDLAKSPGKRQSLLEYGGLVAPDTLEFMQGAYVKQENNDGIATSVFDMTYQGPTGGSHFRLWIDPKTRVVTKRVWYDGDNKLRATFTYLDIHEASPGIWFPGRIEVRNADGVVAAEVAISDVKVNTDLPDSLFDVNQ